jgi:hypothetical protein
VIGRARWAVAARMERLPRYPRLTAMSSLTATSIGRRLAILPSDLVRRVEASRLDANE